MKLTIPLPGLRDRRTIGAAILSAAGIALTALVTAHPAAPSPASVTTAISHVGYTSQGGCNEYTVGTTGFEIGVCINDHGTGTTAYPDIYVNRVGSHTGACSIGIELWDNNGHGYGRAAQAGCNAGHYNGNSYGPVSSPVTLHAFARLQANGTSYYFGAGRGDSPAIALGPASYSQALYNWDIPLTYTVGYIPLVWKVQSTVPNVFKELHRCFNCNFPVPGAPTSYPAFGQLLNLWDIFGLVQAPLRAYPYDASGYLLYVAEPGHFDGAGSTVQFTFHRDSAGYMHLQVAAHAVNNTALQFFSKGGAAARWNQFATQLAANLIANGEGTRTL